MAKNGYIGISDKARKVKSIYIGVNGVARKVKKAYIGVNGVAQEWYSSGVLISSLSAGDSVYMNVNGVRTEFLIVHSGLPSTAYDSSCNGIWLLMKDCYAQMVWNTAYSNDYANSSIHSYLNNTFINLLDSGVKNLVKTVKIPYTVGEGYNEETEGANTNVASGANGLSTRVFLLSAYELGKTSSAINKEGAPLPYFNYNDYSFATAYFNGTAVRWWLRSPSLETSECAVTVNTSGTISGADLVDSLYINTPYVRPALILPTTAMVDSDFNVIA